ncbi:MAG: hypothetical protein Q4F83_04900 [Eubacteriales bacterium]|nr:hypothetical protein [Eubacteriales bacterium]
MAAIDIVITGAILTPNPVYTGRQYIISAEIVPAVHVLGDNEAVLKDEDGALILAPDTGIYALEDNDGAVIIDDDNSIVEMIEEE